jgi:hypothetical protein
LNSRRAALVDANFSTLWLNESARVLPEMLIAYLNSTLASVLFEHVGSVMGGGALKLEATHLASFPVPVFPTATESQLTEFGRGLATSALTTHTRIRTSIDNLVCREIFGPKRASTGLASLTAVLQARLSARHRKY